MSYVSRGKPPNGAQLDIEYKVGRRCALFFFIEKIQCDFVPYGSTWGMSLVAATDVCMVNTIGAGVLLALFRRKTEVVQSQPRWILCSIVGAVVR